LCRLDALGERLTSGPVALTVANSAISMACSWCGTMPRANDTSALLYGFDEPPHAASTTTVATTAPIRRPIACPPKDTVGGEDILPAVLLLSVVVSGPA
jgi:hypothetical protein